MPAFGANIMAVLHAESAGAHSQHMTEIKANKAHTNNLVRSSAAKQFDEPGPAQAKAVEKVLRSKKVA